MRICIDPGHHVSVKGKRSPVAPPGIVEWEFNMAVSLMLSSLCQDAGHEVVRTMNLGDPENKTLKMRRNMAKKCDIFVSIHANAAPGLGWSGGSGFVVFHRGNGYSLAHCIAGAYGQIIPEIRARGTGAKEGRSVGVLKQEIPAVLIECGFMTNEREAKFLAMQSTQERIARAIFAGIQRYSEVMESNP